MPVLVVGPTVPSENDAATQVVYHSPQACRAATPRAPRARCSPNAVCAAIGAGVAVVAVTTCAALARRAHQQYAHASFGNITRADQCNEIPIGAWESRTACSNAFMYAGNAATSGAIAASIVGLFLTGSCLLCACICSLDVREAHDTAGAAQSV